MSIDNYSKIEQDYGAEAKIEGRTYYGNTGTGTITLRKLKQLLRDKEIAEKDLEHYKTKVNQLRKELGTGGTNYVHLPTDNYEKLSKSIWQKQDAAYAKAKKPIVIISVLAIAAVLTLMVFHMISMHYDEEVYYYLGAAILLIIGGLALFSTVIAPIICGIAAICCLYLFLSVTFEVLWIYLVAHIVIIVVACIWRRIQKDSIYSPSYLNRFTKERPDAREKDARNEKENDNRAAATKRNLENSLTPQIEAAKQKCVEFESKINNLQREIRDMTCLAEKDWDGIDFLIEMMTTGRADTLKEALRLLDEKRRRDAEEAKREAQRQYEEFVRKQREQREIEETLERISGHLDKLGKPNQQELERYRAERDRQEALDTLKEISKKLDD